MKFSTFFLLIIIVKFAYSATHTDLKFEHINLTNSQIFYVIQDYKGFMWFGTKNGLYRYDGNSYKIYKYNSDDLNSISNDYIISFCQDSDSVLWIGTVGGLNKFNRYFETFTRYLHDPNDENSISNNNIDVIFEDRFNPDIFWIGTYGGGLCRFNKKTGKSVSSQFDPKNPNSLSNNNVYAVCQDHQGYLWIGTEKGLNKYDETNKKFSHYFHEPNNKNSLSNNIIYSIYEDSDSTLWIGTRGGGLVCLDKDRKAFTRFNQCKPEFKPFDIPQTIYGITPKNRDNLWLATGGSGLSEFNIKSNNFTNFRHEKNNKKSISGNILLQVYKDRQGFLWITAKNEALNYYSENKKRFNNFFTEFDRFEDLNTFVSTFCDFSDDTIWVGTSKGVFKINKKTNNYVYHLTKKYLKKYINKKSESKNIHFRKSNLDIFDYPAKQISKDKNNNIWIGTSGDGLIKYNQKNKFIKKYRLKKNDPNSLISNNISHFLIDSYDNIWIVTYKGYLNILNTKTEHVTRYSKIMREQTGLSNEYISIMFEDRSKNIWIGTGGDGLFKYDREKDYFTNYKHNPHDSLSLADNLITTLFESSAGEIWIGTGNGLNKFNKESNNFSLFIDNRNNPNIYIKSILEDAHGHLWIQTDFNLIKFHPENNSFNTFDYDDGIHINFVKSFFNNHAYKSEDKYMYFGGKSGFLSFNPDSIILNSTLPQIHITGFNVFDKPIKLDSNIVEKKIIKLNYYQNFFSIDFAAMNYISSEKNQFKYRLIGLGEGWINCGNTQIAKFTNVDPGEYVFHVKGSNNDGVWNEDGASLKVIIIPPWWRTNYAYTFYILFFLTGLYLWKNYEKQRQHRNAQLQIEEEKEKSKLREAELRAVAAELQAKALEAQTEVEKEQMRSRIASDLHDEIGSNLSSIALISQTLQKKLKPQPKEKKYLQNINRISKMTADSMRDIIWFINPENDDFQQLIIKMRETANLMLTEINFSFKSPKTKFSFEPDLNFKRNLFLIYKEILQNIIKHSQASKVEIKIIESDSLCILTVKDNGIGFGINEENSGNGLKNINNRVDQIGCEIEIDTATGNGTLIKLTKEIP